MPELLKLTDPAVAVPVLEPRPLGGGLFVYDSPAPEFRLYRAELGGGEIELPGTGGPRIVLCIEGTAVLRAGGDAAGDGAVARRRPHGGSRRIVLPAAADGAVTATGPRRPCSSPPAPTGAAVHRQARRRWQLTAHRSSAAEHGPSRPTRHDDASAARGQRLPLHVQSELRNHVHI